MINLFDKVLIKSENLIGTVVDIRDGSGKTVFTVESDAEGEIDGRDGGIFPLFDCLENEIESVL